MRRYDGHYLIAGLAWLAAWLLAPLAKQSLSEPWYGYLCAVGLVAVVVVSVIAEKNWRP